MRFNTNSFLCNFYLDFSCGTGFHLLLDMLLSSPVKDLILQSNYTYVHFDFKMKAIVKHVVNLWLKPIQHQ